MIAEPPASDEEALAQRAAALVDSVDAAIPSWVAGHLVSRAVWRDAATQVPIANACRDAVLPALRSLLESDIDVQHRTPLEVLAGLVPPVDAVLAAAGAVPVERDAFDVARFPEDRFGLAPRTWADLGPAVAEAGIAWGAAKAYVHLARRRGR